MIGALAASLLRAEPTPEQLDFFESHIRPLLAENCYSCHSSEAATVFAGLRLDSRASLLKGSDAGPVVVPGDPRSSKLLDALRGETLQMPPAGKLADRQIALVEQWIEQGAPWPAEEAPEPRAPDEVFDLEARRAGHWAWQAVASPTPPTVQDADWPLQPLDRFVLARLEAAELRPAAEASRRVLIRRAAFDLTGLPPSPAEIEAFVRDDSPQAYSNLVDRLLASPRFGEHWARKWMDLVRYAESHGSEGDPDTPFAWRYRDYLIRAFNQDIPYDQLLREHLAGDLLPNPRIDPERQLNESLLATAHFRMVEHGFQPVDPWEDRVKWTDNQIDVVSKAFQGLTVACARCHDHKFDAISQKDYYALFGVLKGARPTMRAIDAPERLHQHRERLAELKAEIRKELAAAWGERAAGLAEALLGDELPAESDALWAADSPLHPWAVLRAADDVAGGWRALKSYWDLETAARKAYNRKHFRLQWDLSRPSDYEQWVGHGTGLPDQPSAPGEFAIQPEGDRLLGGVRPSGVFTDLLTPKHNGVLQSPRFQIESDYVSFRFAGGNFSNAQLVIENYAVPRSGIYALRWRPKSADMEWATWKTDYWKGFSAYFEFATLDDITHFQHDAEDVRAKPRPQPERDGRSWFGAGQIVFHDKDAAPREVAFPIQHALAADPVSSREELAELYQRLLTEAVDAWSRGEIGERQAAFLDFFVRNGLLPAQIPELKPLEPLIAEYRRLEAAVPVPRRAPGILEEGGDPQRLLIRGNHKNPGEPVAPRYLTALDCERIDDPRLARLQLAATVASADNPLTARVLVNRLWKELFGRGLVRTVDNFGALGDAPSHPELLDHLATRFVQSGWSLKALLRETALSRAYRMSSAASPAAAVQDPDNALLQHMPVRRLAGESIRDALLAVSGRLDRSMFGPSTPVYYVASDTQTKGDNPPGPLDGEGRRSVYQEIRRNRHNPFLEVFDQPKPATTRGQRDVTNVPAQSLTMLNSPFVIEQAEEWAKRLIAEQATDANARVERMWLAALGRPPASGERDQARQYLAALASEHGVLNGDLLASEPVWRDFAQAIFNLKEFLYIR